MNRGHRRLFVREAYATQAYVIPAFGSPLRPSALQAARRGEKGLMETRRRYRWRVVTERVNTT